MASNKMKIEPEREVGASGSGESRNSRVNCNAIKSRTGSFYNYPVSARAGILANPVIRAVLASSTPPTAAEIATAPGVHAQFIHDTLAALRRAGFIDATTGRRGVVYFATQRTLYIVATSQKRNGGENE